MADKHPESEEVRVVDRRRFTTEGERRDGIEEPPAPPPVTPPPAAAPAPAASTPAESAQSRDARQAYERQAGRRAKLDFETLIRSFAGTAMLQLGLIEDPVQGRFPPDLDAARETIDLLGLLREKTRGNLTPSEQAFLEDVLYQLRVSYVALTSGPRSGAAKGQ
ncbi:MAG TPA: DUF1844 domain-containing protein [Candidatus Xenobia bacterium]|nr:DUF1844 domain-containing protein [Candidatus Xenobia bacterium]